MWPQVSFGIHETEEEAAQQYDRALIVGEGARSEDQLPHHRLRRGGPGVRGVRGPKVPKRTYHQLPLPIPAFPHPSRRSSTFSRLSQTFSRYSPSPAFSHAKAHLAPRRIMTS